MLLLIKFCIIKWCKVLESGEMKQNGIVFFLFSSATPIIIIIILQWKLTLKIYIWHSNIFLMLRHDFYGNDYHSNPYVKRETLIL